MKLKFELTTESIERYGRKLFRIRALMDFTTDQGYKITKGDLGGYLEKSESLNQEGNAWLATDGMAFKDAVIMGGEIWGGVIMGGEIRGGEIWGGEIWGGVIIHETPIYIAGLKWQVTITPQAIRIGCEQHTHKEWEKFDNKRILQMAGKDAAVFWKAHKKMILAMAKDQAKLIRKAN